MEKTHTVRGVLCTVIGASFWGFSGNCGQYLFTYKNIDPTWLTIVRMVAAGIILIAFAAPKYKSELVGIWHNKKDALSLILFSIFGLMACQITYLTAVSYSNAGTATVLQYLEPLIVMVVVCFMAKRLPTGKEVVAIALAITGVFLLATHGDISTLAISPKALSWGLATAFAASLCSILPGKLIKKWSSTVITGYAMLIGGSFLFIISGRWNMFVTLDLGAVLAVIAIITIGTAMAFTLFLQGVSDIGPVKATVLGSAEPVAAAIISVLWMKTVFTAMDIIAFTCILSTVFLLTYRRNKKIPLATSVK